MQNSAALQIQFSSSQKLRLPTAIFQSTDIEQVEKWRLTTAKLDEWQTPSDRLSFCLVLKITNQNFIMMKKILHFIICLACLFVVFNAKAQVFYDVFPCIVDTIYVPEGCVQNYSSIINDNSIMITDGHVGVDNHVASNPLIVYPNPTSNIVNVEFGMENGEMGDVKIQLYDVYGKLLDATNVVGANNHSPLQTAQIDLSRYANGVYVLKAVADGKTVGVRKVVRQ